MRKWSRSQQVEHFVAERYSSSFSHPDQFSGGYAQSTVERLIQIFTII